MTATRSIPSHWREHQGRFKLTWDGLETLTVDACMRPLAWSYQGALYRRGLDGKTVKIERDPDSRYKMHHSTPLTRPAAEALLQAWSDRLMQVRPELAADWLARLAQDTSRFQQIYRPVSILPPDQYRALVLQLTEGCAWNRCHFCNLYRDTPYRHKSGADFAQHVRAARDYFGPALEWRRGIFLGDANVGALPQRPLVKALQYLRQEFPAPLRDEQGGLRHPLGFERVSAFLDTFTGRLRSSDDWSELRQLGLGQLHLGVESGSPEILGLLGKPSQPARVVELVSRLKRAGTAVSILLMVGVGGHQGAADHEQQTVALLRQLALQKEDRIYFSELLVHPNSVYWRLSQEKNLQAMSRAECRQQAERIGQQLPWPAYPDGPILSPYDVRQFVYH